MRPFPPPRGSVTKALPPDMRYYDGRPPEIMKFGTAWQDANFESIDILTSFKAALALSLFFALTIALSTVARGESLGNRAIGIGQPLY
jgi:hypothetical protein